MNPPLNTPAASISFGPTNPFVEHLGFILTAFDGGRSEIHFEPRHEHLNSFSVVHGGVLMTLLDITMGTSARSVEKDMGAVTIEMKASFMQAATGPLRSEGRLIHRSATLAFTEATVYDAAGKACAHATGTFKYVRRLVTGARASNALNLKQAD